MDPRSNDLQCMVHCLWKEIKIGSAVVQYSQCIEPASCLTEPRMTERRMTQVVILIHPSPYMINNKQLYVQEFKAMDTSANLLSISHQKQYFFPNSYYHNLC